MFDANDEVLIKVRCITQVVLIIIAILISVLVIVIAALVSWWYLIALPLFWLFTWLTWLLKDLVFSYMCDVKLIRNKLYGVDNDGLAVFLVQSMNADERQKLIDQEQEIKERLEDLETQKETDKISKEDYSRQKISLQRKLKKIERTLEFTYVDDADEESVEEE